MKKFIINNLWWVVFIIAAILLIAHIFSFKTIKVDNTTITLLILILISPFISAIKKIKFGDFEAEISSKEVQKVKEGVDAKLSEISEGNKRVIT